MITLDAWQPPTEASYNDISASSAYNGRFPIAEPSAEQAALQMQAGVNMAPSVQGLIANGEIFPILLVRDTSAITRENFHSNVGKWFAPHHGFAGDGYLRVIWEDGTTQLRIPARVVSKQILPGVEDVYRIMLQATQPHFEELSTSTLLTNDGNVRAGVQIAFTGASRTVYEDLGVAASAVGYVNTLLPVDVNVTHDTTWRVVINGVPVPWMTTSAAHILAVANVGAGKTYDVEVVTGISGVDPLHDAFTAAQLNPPGIGINAWEYETLMPSDVLGDTPLGGLWRLDTYQPDQWSYPADWRFSAEDAATWKGCTFQYTDGAAPSGDVPYNALYLHTGGTLLSGSMTNWRRVLNNFTATECRAHLMSRQAGSSSWISEWSSDSDGSTTTSITLTANTVELMWVIESQTDTYTTDPDFTIEPNASTEPQIAIPSGAVCSTSSRVILDGTWTNDTTGQSITFTDLIYGTSGALTLEMWTAPHLRDLAHTGRTIWGNMEFSDPNTMIELAPGVNSVTDGVTGTYVLTHRHGYL